MLLRTLKIYNDFKTILNLEYILFISSSFSLLIFYLCFYNYQKIVYKDVHNL